MEISKHYKSGLFVNEEPIFRHLPAHHWIFKNDKVLLLSQNQFLLFVVVFKSIN